MLIKKKIFKAFAHTMPRKVAKKGQELKPYHVAAESGIYLSNGHNAFETHGLQFQYFVYVQIKRKELKNEKVLQSRE